MEKKILDEKEKNIENTEEVKKNEKKQKKIPKEVSQEILKKIFNNFLKGIVLMLYFIVLNMAHLTMKQERLLEDIKIFAGAYLLLGIVMLERAYKNEKLETALTGIEFLCISIHSLTIMHIITLLKYDFRLYLLTSSYIFSIYFVLKSIILYTKEKRDYLRSFSDISEIVKKEEPQKKEAKKKIEIEDNIESFKSKENSKESEQKVKKKKATKSKEDSKQPKKSEIDNKTKEGVGEKAKKKTTKKTSTTIEKRENKSTETKNIKTKSPETKSKEKSKNKKILNKDK